MAKNKGTEFGRITSFEEIEEVSEITLSGAPEKILIGRVANSDVTITRYNNWHPMAKKSQEHYFYCNRMKAKYSAKMDSMESYAKDHDPPYYIRTLLDSDGMLFANDLLSLIKILRNKQGKPPITNLDHVFTLDYSHVISEEIAKQWLDKCDIDKSLITIVPDIEQNYALKHSAWELPYKTRAPNNKWVANIQQVVFHVFQAMAYEKWKCEEGCEYHETVVDLMDYMTVLRKDYTSLEAFNYGICSVIPEMCSKCKDLVESETHKPLPSKADSDTVAWSELEAFGKPEDYCRLEKWKVGTGIVVWIVRLFIMWKRLENLSLNGPMEDRIDLQQCLLSSFKFLVPYESRNQLEDIMGTIIMKPGAAEKEEEFHKMAVEFATGRIVWKHDRDFWEESDDSEDPGTSSPMEHRTVENAALKKPFAENKTLEKRMKSLSKEQAALLIKQNDLQINKVVSEKGQSALLKEDVAPEKEQPVPKKKKWVVPKRKRPDPPYKQNRNRRAHKKRSPNAEPVQKTEVLIEEPQNAPEAPGPIPESSNLVPEEPKRCENCVNSKNMCKKVQVELESAKSTIVELRDKVNTTDNLERTVEKLEKEMRELKEAHEAEKRKMEKEHSELVKYQNQKYEELKQSASEQATSMSEKIGVLEARLMVKDAKEPMDVKPKKRELQELTRRLNLQSTEVTNLKALLIQKDATHTRLTKDNALLTQEASLLRNEVKSLGLQLNSARTAEVEYAAVEAFVKKQQLKITELEKENSKLKQAPRPTIPDSADVQQLQTNYENVKYLNEYYAKEVERLVIELAKMKMERGRGTN